MSEETTRNLSDNYAFEERVFARFDAMDARFNLMESRFEARFNVVDSRFDAVDARFDAMETRFDRRFDDLDTRVQAWKPKRSTLNRSGSALWLKSLPLRRASMT